MSEINLCNYKSERVDIDVRACIEDGCLTIEGQDVGKSTKEFWGDSDYEYWYKFDKGATEKLCQLLTKRCTIIETALLQVLKQKYSGIDGCKKLRNFCDKNDIDYKFSNYV